jgi:nitrile hydratase
MNGVHDMGGMQDMGAVRKETNEPVFHAQWEARVYALNRAMRAWGKVNLDAWRHDIELLPPADYLRMTYYEKWLAVLEKQLARYGFVTEEELESGKAASGSSKAKPALTLEGARQITRSIPSSQYPAIHAGFRAGDRVRARNINPAGHTRLPRYARGRYGVVFHDHGVYAFPDTNSRNQGQHRQHVYSVRFAARELWGDQSSPLDAVHLDLFEDYLEHA